jgi:Uma2 family endonuclease
MAAHPLPRLTPQQYLDIERAAELRSEYYDGQMYAMSGGSLEHSLIPMQAGAALVNALRGRSCRVASSDLRVRVSSTGPFYYPDISVYCGEPQLADDYRDTLLNPRAILEVLSKSTENYDRGLKFDAYRQIESLHEYVLIWQSEPRIEVWLRQPEGRWKGSYYAGMDAVCVLESLDCSTTLADVYEGISFDKRRG